MEIKGGRVSDKLPSYRAGMEKELRKITGRTIYITQFNIFAFVCGCVGIAVSTVGLQREDVEIFGHIILRYFNNIAKELDMETSIVYAKMIPGTHEVLLVTACKLCAECEKDYSTAKTKITPWGDLYILHFNAE